MGYNQVGGAYDNGGYSKGSGFALLVVLFILLIIIGASFHNKY
ncbi:MAG TPA: YjcZ family sporulation protein [Ureibacillus sp.]|nr:YjcZ family sporulation protein [Ureibacillus sp.]